MKGNYISEAFDKFVIYSVNHTPSVNWKCFNWQFIISPILITLKTNGKYANITSTTIWMHFSCSASEPSTTLKMFVQVITCWETSVVVPTKENQTWKE